MPYQLSRKQLNRLNEGYPLLVALPPDPACIEASDNWLVNEARLLAWAVAQLTGLGRAAVTSAEVRTVWLDCERPLGGLTEFFGGAIPDIGRHSPNGLPPIPVSVVVCEIRPHYEVSLPNTLVRIQWPGSYVSPTGYTYGVNTATAEPADNDDDLLAACSSLLALVTNPTRFSEEQRREIIADSKAVLYGDTPVSVV